MKSTSINSFVVAAMLAGCAGARAGTSAVVFHTPVDGSPIYRAPQLAVAKDGSLLAFVEARETLDDPGRGPGRIRMQVKRSTDNGLTWSAARTLAADAAFDFAGAAPVVDRLSGDVTLMFYRIPNVYPSGDVPTGIGPDTVNTFIMRSADHGLTWSTAENITAQVKDPITQVFGVSPATGIQLRWQTDPSRNGRLVIPAMHSDATHTRNVSLVNDAGGATGGWQAKSLTPFSGMSVNESDIVELVNGDLLLDARPNDETQRRQRFISKDGGSTWGTPFYGDVATPGVDAGLARLSAKRDGDDRNRLVYSAPLGLPLGAANGRVHLGVWTSYDEGKTFINPVQVAAEADGYSNLQRLPDGRLGITYETTELGGGTAQFNINRVMFKTVSATELEGQPHARALTHYDGFGNKIDATRGGMGWSGGWAGQATPIENGTLPFSGFRMPTEAGRFDLVRGQAIERTLATPVDMNENGATYLSLVISRKNDPADPVSNSFLGIDLRDGNDVSHASFGVSSAKQFVTGRLGDGEGTAPGSVKNDATYFVVMKIVTQDDSSGGNFDQLFMKVFESGVDAVPDTDELMGWTVVGGAGENKAALLNHISIAGGLGVTWSIDELRIGTTFGSVASGVAAVPEPASAAVSMALIGYAAGRRRKRFAR